MAWVGDAARHSFVRDHRPSLRRLSGGCFGALRCAGVGWQPPYLLVEVLIGHGGVVALRLSWTGLIRSGSSVLVGVEVAEVRLLVKLSRLRSWRTMPTSMRRYLDEGINIAALVSSLGLL